MRRNSSGESRLHLIDRTSSSCHFFISLAQDLLVWSAQHKEEDQAGGLDEQDNVAPVLHDRACWTRQSEAPHVGNQSRKPGAGQMARIIQKNVPKPYNYPPLPPHRPRSAFPAEEAASFSCGSALGLGRPGLSVSWDPAEPSKHQPARAWRLGTGPSWALLVIVDRSGHPLTV